MGRKPNPVVLEFFDRGNKLEDSSNRYQHTCKRCGQLFPKGRVDTLLNHTLRHCRSATMTDRQIIVLHISEQSTSNLDIAKLHKSLVSCDNMDSAAPDQTSFAWQPPDETVQFEGRLSSSYPAEISLPSSYPLESPSNSREQSALDTLAEVSRRHLNYAPRRMSQVDDIEGRLHATLLQHEASKEPDRLAPHSPTAVSASAFDPSVAVSATEPESVERGPTAVNVAADFNLIQAASAANKQLREQSCPDQVVQQQDDNLFNGIETQQHVSNPTSTDFYPNEMSWSPTNVTGATTLEQAPLSGLRQDSSVGFGILADRKKGKSSRGRFAEIRRKEVHEIRKRGACIRCRMLKKPCSEGTPCNTCKNVESARLWKSRCLRSRVAEEFTLWSRNLFHTLARNEVPIAVQGLQGQPLPGRLEIGFIPGSNLRMSFLARRYCHTSDGQTRDHVDPVTHHNAQLTSSLVLLDEGEGMAEKIEAYINSERNAFAERMSDGFLGRTLRYALNISNGDQAATVDKAKAGNRSCYNIQNMLLRNVIELLIETNLLACTRLDSLVLYYEPGKEPSKEPELRSNDSLAAASPPAQLHTHLMCLEGGSRSHSLIKAQLLAVLEARCAKLSKLVTNELERRLLQRQQVSGFATFIASILLLRGVEMMSQLFYDSESPHEWLVEDHPRVLAQQGEHFSDLVIMLMKMRALPPKIFANANGHLEVDKHSLHVDQLAKGGAHTAHVELVEAASAWLDPMVLDAGILKGQQNNPTQFDMRFVARLLLSE